MILIGGTGYTGEIKKGIFTVLNYVLPQERGVLSMHCSANIGKDGDTAVFFGLSGTGKTTLSADPERRLIGDDEHGWSDNGVFNFEGGCYAKCIDLSARRRNPRSGTPCSSVPSWRTSCSRKAPPRWISPTGRKTENTRVSYPIELHRQHRETQRGRSSEEHLLPHLRCVRRAAPDQQVDPGTGHVPLHQRLHGEGGRYRSRRDRTAEHRSRACFGKAFLPLHPTKYADMLGEKMKQHDVHVWLVNTGWSGGAYGTGERMKLKLHPCHDHRCPAR